MHREVYYALSRGPGPVGEEDPWPADALPIARERPLLEGHAPPALLDVIGSDLGARVMSQVQTLAMAVVLLTMTLGLWWWAEADPGP